MVKKSYILAVATPAEWLLDSETPFEITPRNVDRYLPLDSDYNLARQLRPRLSWSVCARILAWLRCLAIVKMVAALS